MPVPVLLLEAFEFAQISHAFRQAGDFPDQRQAILFHLFILRHDENLVKEGGDGWDENSDDCEKFIDIVEPFDRLRAAR